MAISRAKKVEIAEDVSARLNDSEVMIITKNNGMTVAQVSELRNKAREAGASYKVAKNRIIKRVLPESNYSSLEQYFTGPTGITTSADPVGAAKTVVEFAKANEQLEIIAGAYGDQELDIAGIKNLASMPSMDELRAKIIAMLTTPATRIAGVTQAPAGQLARVISAYSKKES